MLSLAFPDGLLTITIALAIGIAITGGLSWWLARRDAPVDVARELRERRNGDD